MKTRNRKIIYLEGKVSELFDNLKHASISHAYTDTDLHHSKEEYRKIFDEKEALATEGIKKAS